MLYYHLRSIRSIVNTFKVLELYEKNKELFNRFNNLKKKFPDLKRSPEIYMNLVNTIPTILTVKI